MTLPTLPQLVVDALRSAGATEEMIAAAVKASGEFPTPQAGRRGRPRKYRTRAECDRAYYERRKHHEKNHEENKDKTSQYEKNHEEIALEELREETLALTRLRADLRGDTHVLSLEEVKAIARDETRDKTPPRRPPSDERGDETPKGYLWAGIDEETGGNGDLWLRLLEAAEGNFEASSDISPIRALIDQGCDLEADILPIIAREVPELPRPLKTSQRFLDL
jgi:hypothetical protein